MIYRLQAPNTLITVTDHDITSWPVEALSKIARLEQATNASSGLQKAIEQKPAFLLVSKKAVLDERMFDLLKDHPEVTIIIVQPIKSFALKSLLPLGARFCASHEHVADACLAISKMLPLHSPVLYHLRHFDDARWLASSLARKSVNPHACQVALSELMLNAIEHGNLEIGYSEKTKLIHDRSWLQEIEKRLEQPEHAKKIVTVTSWIEEGQQFVRIQDSGKGFDHTQYTVPAPTAARSTHQHGRGILIATGSETITVSYEPPGNRVLCAFTLKA